MQVKLKRAYEKPGPEDGTRVLVDRLWPRGMSKEEAHIDIWLKEIAPSHKLRKWFGHERGKWEAFKRSYFRELEDAGNEAATRLMKLAGQERITLIFAARDERLNNAVALKEHLEDRFSHESQNA